MDSVTRYCLFPWLIPILKRIILFPLAHSNSKENHLQDIISLWGSFKFPENHLQANFYLLSPFIFPKIIYYPSKLPIVSTFLCLTKKGIYPPSIVQAPTVLWFSPCELNTFAWLFSCHFVYFEFILADPQRVSNRRHSLYSLGCPGDPATCPCLSSTGIKGIHPPSPAFLMTLLSPLAPKRAGVCASKRVDQQDKAKPKFSEENNFFIYLF